MTHANSLYPTLPDDTNSRPNWRDIVEDIVAADLNAFEALIRAIQDRLGNNTYGGGPSGFFAYPHPSGGLRLRVNPGNLYSTTASPLWVAQQDTGSLTGPVTNPRIDVAVLDNTTGAVSWVAGSEGASPAVPSITSGKTAIWAVYLRVGATSIDRFGYDTGVNSYIYRDMRPSTTVPEVAGGAPSGAAGGDLSGTYPNPQIASGVIVNTDVNASAAVAESKLAFDGTAGHAHIGGTGGKKITPTTGLNVTGTPDGTKFLRDDNTWSVPPGTGSGGGGSAGGTGLISFSLKDQTVGSGATSYADLTGELSATENIVRAPVSTPVTISQLRVVVDSQPGTGSITFTVRKNGVDTTVTCTVAAGAGSDAAASDTLHSVDFAAGDYIDIKIVNGASATSGGIRGVSLQAGTGPVVAGPGWAWSFNDQAFVASSTSYIGPNGAVSTTEAAVQAPLPVAATLRNLRAVVNSQPASGTLAITVRKNGADTGLTCTVPAGSGANYLASDAVNSVPFAAGDYLSIKVVNNATANSGGLRGVSLEVDAASQSTPQGLPAGGVGDLYGLGDVTVTASATRFLTGFSAVSAEADAQLPVPRNCNINSLRVRTRNAQDGSGSLVFTVRKNGVDTALTLTVAAGAGAATFADTAHNVVFAAGDLFSLKAVDGATADSVVVSWSVAVDAPNWGGSRTITSADSPYTPSNTDYFILCDTSGGSITVNLPAVAAAPLWGYAIKKIASGNTMTIDPNGAETVDGAATVAATSIYTSYTLLPAGGAWWVT